MIFASASLLSKMQSYLPPDLASVYNGPSAQASRPFFGR
jgi:hypothetical protein